MAYTYLYQWMALEKAPAKKDDMSKSESLKGIWSIMQLRQPQVVSQLRLHSHGDVEFLLVLNHKYRYFAQSDSERVIPTYLY